MRRLTVFLAAAAFGWFGSPRAAQAQTTAPSPQAAASPLTQEQILDLLRAYRCDDVIEKIGDALSQEKDPNPNRKRLLHYFRGRAYFLIGFLDEAETDLQAAEATAAGSADPLPVPLGYNAPRWFLEAIARQKEARPPHRQEIRGKDGKITFVVWYDRDDAVARGIIEMLPDASNVIRDLLGAPPPPTTILLFGSRERLAAYGGAANRKLDTKWNVGAGGRAGVNLLQNASGFVRGMNSGGSRAAIAHELMHSTQYRFAGKSYDLVPPWIREGTAEIAGDGVGPANEALRYRAFQRAINGNAIVSLADMSSDAFYKVYDDRVDGKTNSLAEPYAQASNMTHYLLLNRPRYTLMELLTQTRNANSFPKGFAATFGETLEAFYRDWREYIHH